MFLKVLLIILIILVAALLFLGFIALLKKRSSVYRIKSSEKNSMEGKKVIFVEDENDKKNVDGVKGYLEAVGESTSKKGFYNYFLKRVIDLHYGHINLLKIVKAFWNYPIVVPSGKLNRKEKHKKTYFLYLERKALVEAIRYVASIIPNVNW